tara:strand:+ start:214 stop:597 length:384 start_codon:yes stop_codon:yes gene_type:complete
MYFDLLNDLAREFPSETSTDAKLISFLKILLLTVLAEISNDLIMGTLLDLRIDKELVNLDKFESTINLLIIGSFNKTLSTKRKNLLVPTNLIPVKAIKVKKMTSNPNQMLVKKFEIPNIAIVKKGSC